MLEFLLKIFGWAINIFWSGKLKELQISIKRINPSNPKEIEEFTEVYDETFPYDGHNYTSDEMLSFLEDINNSKKHVLADNILLVAKYKDNVIGFIACFYYPEKRYGILGYFGKSKQFKEESKYVSKKILRKLKRILENEHDCQLIIYELEPSKRGNEKDRLFRLFAKSVGLEVYEIAIDYQRPKLNLEDIIVEEQLKLMVVPIKEAFKKKMSKKKALDILEFVHLCCYGDYYDKSDKNFSRYQKYMRDRLELYKQKLPNTITLN